MPADGKLRFVGRAYRRFESFFLIYRRRRVWGKNGRRSERNEKVCGGKGKEEEKKAERVACLRAAGLMSLIMEKYIKRHPQYFLKGIPRFALASRVSPPLRDFATLRRLDRRVVIGESRMVRSSKYHRSPIPAGTAEVCRFFERDLEDLGDATLCLSLGAVNYDGVTLVTGSRLLYTLGTQSKGLTC